ncbi:MAG: hypothetical protein ACLFVQ_03745 [Chitinispirillaceae bacterium]
MDNNEWINDEQRRKDLLKENARLEKELEDRGLKSSKFEECDPQIENEFLKSILAHEKACEGEMIPVRSLFPSDYELPSADSMSDTEIREKIIDIEKILSEHNVEFGFAHKLPASLLYNHLVEYITEDTVGPEVIEGFTWVLDGCTGVCEECFQLDYCESGQEIKNADDSSFSMDSSGAE